MLVVYVEGSLRLEILGSGHSRLMTTGSVNDK